MLHIEFHEKYSSHMPQEYLGTWSWIQALHFIDWEKEDWKRYVEFPKLPVNWASLQVIWTRLKSKNPPVILSCNMCVLWIFKILCRAYDNGEASVLTWMGTGLKLHQHGPSSVLPEANSFSLFSKASEFNRKQLSH